MPKNTKLFSLPRQKRALLALEWSTGFRPAGSVWVLLLALRGFSLVEIGLAEGVFHAVSLCCELPSGLMADLLGRKRTLTASQLMFLLSALLMAGTADLGGVCLALAISAAGYNLQSGTREAVTYESMLQAGRETDYLQFSSLQNAVYRFSGGGAMLLAGATVRLGWQTAYLLDAGIALAGLAAALILSEPVCSGRENAGVTLRSLPEALRQTAQGAWTLLKTDRTAVRIMLVNALIGACATLTQFFLQQRVEAAMPVPALLGPALFVLGLGGGLAGLLTGRLDRLPYWKAAALTGTGVLACALAAQGRFLPALLAAGLLAGLLDDSLQLVSDKRLNDRFPSAQRATLVSVSSMAFSVFMIPLSPVFGWWFSRL
ncbi:MAG: MFS transporter [Oscillospiraceae bacterium]|jgi:MFS family permease|nr:MFS transporter [Oscillospiraceae bacterium]